MTMLQRGIPAVRVNGIDYRLRLVPTEHLIIATPATGEADATLVLTVAKDRP